MRNSIAKPPVLPLDVSGVSQAVLEAFTDEELDTAVAQLTDHLVASYSHLGSTTPTDMYHRALLLALRCEQMRRLEKSPPRSLLLSEVPQKANIFELYGEVE